MLRYEDMIKRNDEKQIQDWIFAPVVGELLNPKHTKESLNGLLAVALAKQSK